MTAACPKSKWRITMPDLRNYKRHEYRLENWWCRKWERLDRCVAWRLWLHQKEQQHDTKLWGSSLAGSLALPRLLGINVQRSMAQILFLYVLAHNAVWLLLKWWTSRVNWIRKIHNTLTHLKLQTMQIFIKNKIYNNFGAYCPW